MDKITQLAISYPDFQLNQIIDPDQIDLNNAQIVDKINKMITAFNTVTQDTTGATHITIATLPEFPTAKQVQQALSQIATYTKENNTTIQQILAKNTEQDTRLTKVEARATAVEIKNTEQDTRLTNLETRATNVESKNTTQDTRLTNLETRETATEIKNAQQDTRLGNIETKNTQQEGTLSNHASRLQTIEEIELPTIKQTTTTHGADIAQIKLKDSEQDTRIGAIETREELDTIWVEAIDGKVETNKTNIAQIQKDLNEIASGNAVAELIDARTSGHTGERFEKVGDRLDDLEIPIAVDVPPGKRSKVNFLITDSNTTGTWEDSVKLGDITLHNADETAHPSLIANHELDSLSHNDIRESVLDVDNRMTTLVNNTRDTLDEKINANTDKVVALETNKTDKTYVDTQDKTLADKINVLEVNCVKDDGLAYTTKLGDEFINFGEYTVSDFNNDATWDGLIKVEGRRNYIKQTLTLTNQGLILYRTTHNKGVSWSEWKTIATTQKTEILWEGTQASGNIVLSKALTNYHSLLVVCGDSSTQQTTEIIPPYYPTKINTSVIFVAYNMSNFIRLNPKSTDTINILANAGSINVKKIIGVLRGDV